MTIYHVETRLAAGNDTRQSQRIIDDFANYDYHINFVKINSTRRPVNNRKLR